ncbi:MAG: putative transporter transrane protein [Acidimicrobiaceae bacterium]|nr:putative transporter transrane protein [Acidimicrobiaceae bacterium]
MDSPAGRYGLPDAIRSEWTKLSTVRSTAWTLLVTVVAAVGLGALVSWVQATHYANNGFIDRATFDPTRVSLSGLLFAQLAVGVLGVLVMSAEYGTGTIRATLSAMPRRVEVLWAKALVFGSLILVVGEILSLAAFFLGQSILSSRAPHATLGDPGALRAVLGAGCYLTALGLLALGLATVVRHTAGGISAFVGVLFVLPVISDALPSSVSVHVNKFLPADIGVSMLSTQPTGTAFPPWGGFTLLCGYAAVALVVGTVLLRRRDA